MISSHFSIESICEICILLYYGIVFNYIVLYCIVENDETLQQMAILKEKVGVLLDIS